MIVLSRNVNSTYEPPSRYEISGKYLTSIHESCRREGIEILVVGGPSLGIGIFGMEVLSAGFPDQYVGE